MAEESGADRYPHYVDESPWLCLISRVLPSREPPSADPHARWCGKGGLNTRPYPIRCPISFRLVLLWNGFYTLLLLRLFFLIFDQFCLIFEQANPST